MSAASTYNEAFDEAGHLRAPYRAFDARTGRDSFRPSEESVAGLTHRPLGDAFSIFPTPLVLDDQEYRHTISAGVRQRALALQSLFHDLIRGESTVFRKTTLPMDLFPRILEQEGTRMSDLARWWEGKNREAVRFVYAPDLVRAPDGRWQILEDNLGCVGGVVDGHLVAESFLAHTNTHLHDAVPRGSDLARAVRGFLARIGKTPESPDVVALLGDECASTGSEASRKKRVLRELGLRVLNRVELEEATRQGLRSHDVAAIVNFDTRGWIPTSELTDEMFGRRGVPLMMAPGLDALGNKSLLPFLDDVVAFYSGEDPILRTARTELCGRMPDDPSGWVIKRSNGCQGTGVFFLDRMNAIERSALGSDLPTWGREACAVMQRRVSASFLPTPVTSSDRFQVELRPVAFMVGDSVCVVGEHAAARAFRNDDGRGLGNMSRGAQYLSVIREPAPPSRLTR